MIDHEEIATRVPMHSMRLNLSPRKSSRCPTRRSEHVVAQVQTLNPQVVGVLKSLNTLRNSNFGHGMTVPFGFTGAEVDFTYLTCVAGILLFSRMP